MEIDLNALYTKNFNKIKFFVKRNSGNEADAEDLLQDGMIVLYAKIREKNFKLTASIDTYLFAICKNLWFKKLRDQNYEVSLDELNSNDFKDSIDHSTEKEISYKERLKILLTRITKHCNKLIHDMFYREKSVNQVQKEYGYSSPHNAQNQKYKCVEQLKKAKKQEENLKKNNLRG